MSIDYIILCFNPTLVRLRPGSGSEQSMPPEPFQSHAGSIEAYSDSGAASGSRFCFNPTLVRLRLDGQGQPHGRQLGFNPTLVRLRRGVHAPIQERVLPFQSHAGSIEATKNLPATVHSQSVSIPRWFD